MKTELTEYEIGYIAGFIDGEGCLAISKREHTSYQGKRYIGYSAHVELVNTNRECLEWIREKIQANPKIYEHKLKGNRKLAYRLRIGYKEAKPLIEKLADRLIVKRNIAKVFLEYGSTEDKESVWLKARELNKRGISDVQRL